MRSASFHFAMRSERAKEPTLSWPAPQPTARWTIVTSSVSPERAETIAPQPASRAASSAALRLGQRAGLVRLDQHRVARRRPPPRARTRAGIGHEEIVADDLHPVADRRGEAAQPVGVVLGERVLDRHDRIAVEPADQHLDHAVGVERRGRRRPGGTAPSRAELRGGDVERDRDLAGRA